MKLRRAPLAAVCGVVVLLFAAPAAQANRVSGSSASCVLVNNVPTVTFDVVFKDFGPSNMPVTGTIWIDGTSYAVPEFSWQGSDHTLQWTHATTPGTHKLKGVFSWPNRGHDNNKTIAYVTCPPPKTPSITLIKTGAAFAYAGDTVTYYFDVTNGPTPLTDVTVTDPRCTSAPVRTAGDASFDPGETWKYSCTAVVPSGVTQVDNTAEACGKYGGTKVCDSDDHSFPVRTIAIQVDKAAVEQTAVAGSTVHFTIAVKNTGNTAYAGYVFDDPNCDEQRTGANASDATLDPDETWTYACAMATQAGQTSADNTATATGTNSDNRSATDNGSASIPLTPPAGTPQTPPPGAGSLPESAASGLARLSGPSGCVRRAFRARVNGRSITSVAFYVDGKLVKRFTANRSSYSIKVKPGRLGLGRHRVVARVKFVAASGTKARRMPLTFRRCAGAQVTPRFTG